jgi:hypothetical protein
LRKKKQTRFEAYRQSLPKEGQEALEDFFRRARVRLALGKKDNGAMLADFEEAFLYYASAGTPLADALRLLDPVNLGGYYARTALLWYPLDDAAKVYPLSMQRNRMAVFRLSATLTREVEPALLQTALSFTLRRFPSFATTVKKGFFWHYLDAAKRRFSIEAERGIPCRPLDVSGSGAQSFRVLYYKNRISVEFFHVLTDGTGGMVFLKTLTAQYLRLLGEDVPAADGVLDVNDESCAEETENGFDYAEAAENPGKGFLGQLAVQLGGRPAEAKPCRILHFRMEADALKAAARENGATVTAYVLSLMFLAQRGATDLRTGDFSIQVPVNMRKFYPSRTLRNFAMYCSVRLPVSRTKMLEDVLPEVSAQLETKASESAMRMMMAATRRMTRSLRYVPLLIKRPAARLAYGFLGDRVFTNTLSNLGVVRVPEEMAQHVEEFDFVLGTGVVNRARCTLVTFRNTATLTVSKYTVDPSFEEALFRLLTEGGMCPRMEGSELYGR